MKKVVSEPALGPRELFYVQVLQSEIRTLGYRGELNSSRVARERSPAALVDLYRDLTEFTGHHGDDCTTAPTDARTIIGHRRRRGVPGVPLRYGNPPTRNIVEFNDYYLLPRRVNYDYLLRR
ncbi:hypothetical protein EVAR_80479_1 [Eumeta japonica]|uniref:Uncharacterized protein n=1 Tax=Eumeta variegata TaxID=151549 RepID=A0A4C1YNV1_EUMVA|nr:hypothetical protein EVAR_80479_1 [Eumeta japonica]